MGSRNERCRIRVSRVDADAPERDQLSGIPTRIFTPTGLLFTCAGWKIHFLKVAAIASLTLGSCVRLTETCEILPSVPTTAKITTWWRAYFFCRVGGICGHSLMATEGGTTCCDPGSGTVPSLITAYCIVQVG